MWRPVWGATKGPFPLSPCTFAMPQPSWWSSWATPRATNITQHSAALWSRSTYQRSCAEPTFSPGNHLTHDWLPHWLMQPSQAILQCQDVIVFISSKRDTHWPHKKQTLACLLCSHNALCQSLLMQKSVYFWLNVSVLCFYLLFILMEHKSVLVCWVYIHREIRGMPL